MDIPVPVLWIVSGTLALLGSWIIIVNYACAIQWYVRRKHSSMIPLLGGVLFALAMLHCPMPGVRRLAWLPLIFDPGCLFTLLSFLYAVFVLKCFKK